MLGIVVFFISFRWIHVSTPLISVFQFLLILISMPNLKATVELGPSVDWHVWHSPVKKYKFDVRVPVRAPFTIESPPRSIGCIVSPNLALDIADPAGFKGWNLGLETGPVFASHKY